MRQVFRDLWVSEPEFPHPGEYPQLMFHSFLLSQPDGNILFYRSEHETDHDHIARLGGVRRHYLAHSHEAGPGLERIKSRFRPRLAAHRKAGPRIESFAALDDVLDLHETLPDGIEVIPVPGHTDNNVCYRLRAENGETYLFAGDVLFPSRGTWQAAVFRDEGGDTDQLKASLRLLADYEPDIVLFSATIADPAIHRFTPKEWRSALAEASRSLDRNPVRTLARAG